MSLVVKLITIYISEFEKGDFKNYSNLVEIVRYHKSVQWSLPSSPAINELMQAFYRLSEEQAKDPKNAIAKFNLALFFLEGIIVETNYPTAQNLYQQAIELEHSGSMNHLAFMYSSGKGVEKNPTLATQLYEQASLLGNSMAMANLAYIYDHGRGVEQNYEKARQLYEQASLLGNSMAMVNLGLMYEHNQGVEKNYEKARQLYEQASNLGNRDAMSYLAFMYENGLGVEKNPKQAIQLYEKASEFGNNNAMYRLAFRYQHGHGIEKDYEKARQLYELAIKLGNRDAMNDLAFIYQHGYGIEKDYEKARQLYEQASDLKHPKALSNLAFMYLNAQGVERNYEKARQLYEEAGNLGNSNGLTRVASMYEQGQVVTKNLKLAIQLYEKACAFGNSMAMTKLAILYQNGSGVRKNHVKARQLYEQASVLKNSTAMANLALMYEQGKGGVNHNDYKTEAARLRRRCGNFANLEKNPPLCHQFHKALHHNNHDVALKLISQHPILLQELLSFEYTHYPQSFDLFISKIAEAEPTFFQDQMEWLKQLIWWQHNPDPNQQSYLISIKLRFLDAFPFKKLDKGNINDFLFLLSTTSLDFYSSVPFLVSSETPQILPILIKATVLAMNFIESLKWEEGEDKGEHQSYYQELALILIKYKFGLQYDLPLSTEPLTLELLGDIKAICLDNLSPDPQRLLNALENGIRIEKKIPSNEGNLHAFFKPTISPEQGRTDSLQTTMSSKDPANCDVLPFETRKKQKYSSVDGI